jgi:hypothetical protein
MNADERRSDVADDSGPLTDENEKGMKAASRVMKAAGSVTKAAAEGTKRHIGPAARKFEPEWAQEVHCATFVAGAIDSSIFPG